MILLVNKIDLLPADVSLERVEKWVRTEAKARGLSLHGVFLVSAFTGLNLKRVAQAINELRKERDVFVMGLSNVGKSSVINKLWPILNDSNSKNSRATVSNVPGTTVASLGLPFSDGTLFYDTPGIMPEDGLARVLSLNDYTTALPKKRLRPRLKRVRLGETLFIGGYARIDFLRGPSFVNLLTYAASELDLRIMPTEQADAASLDRLYDPMSAPFRNREILLHPRKTARPSLHSHPSQVIECKDGYNRASLDIVFSGIGWVAVAAKAPVQLRPWYLNDCLVSMRPPLMPFDISKTSNK